MWKSFSWVVVANLSRQLAFLIVNLVLIERLSRVTFGAVSLAFSYMVVFIGLGDFGIRQIGWRDIAREPTDIARLSGPLITAKALTMASAVGVFFLMMPLLWEPASPKSIYFAFGVGIILNGTTFDFPFYGINRIDLMARYSLVAFACYCIGCLVLVRQDSHAWLVPALFAASMALLLALQLVWFQARYGFPRLGIAKEELARILKQAWPLGASETVNRVANNYPLILIGMLIGHEGVGNYRVAELAYAFLAQFGHLVGVAGFSRVAHTFRKDRSRVSTQLKKMLLPAMAASLLAGVALATVGPSLLSYFVSNTGPESEDVLRLLGIALVLAVPARLLKALLPSIDRQETLLVVNLLTLAVAATGGWFAISAYGIAGMAAAVAFAELISVASLIWVYRYSLDSTRTREPHS
jgi:O-antigen/teichoic acid export membrane protein